MSKVLAFILLATWACAVDAQPLDLYAGEVQVQGKGEAERRQALPSALIHVLQKLSGQRELPPSPLFDAALASAERIMLAFSYEERQRSTPDGDRVAETWLIVRFLPGEVNRIILELGLPRWRLDRSPLVIWVAIDDGSGRRLMPVEYAHAWDAMQRVARYRGLPVIWPERDPAGQTPLDLSLIWGGFTDQLSRPAGATGGVVAVAARRVGPDWNVRWTYDDGIGTVGWRTSDRILSSALTDGIHRIVDLVAERDSIRGGRVGDWHIRITVAGLDGPEAYARCLSYLENTAVIDRVLVEAAQPGEVDFALNLNAEPRYLLQLFKRDGLLFAGDRPDHFRLAERRRRALDDDH